MRPFRARDLGFDIDTDADVGLSPEERGCVPTRRTADLLGECGIFSILRERLQTVERSRKTLPTGNERVAWVKALARIRNASEAKAFVKELGVEEAEDCTVTHLAFLYPTGLALPAELIARKGTAPKSVVVSVGRKGRVKALANVRDVLIADKAVLVADLTGLGSIGEGRYLFYGAKEFPEEGTSAMLYLMGESMVGRRATDLLVMADWLKTRGFADVSLVAEDDVAIAAAHALAVEPSSFSSVRKVCPAASWTSAFDAANDGKMSLYYTTIVNGALNHYDWIDL